MYARAARPGFAVVAGSIIPYNTATPEQNARMRQINDWIRRQPRAPSFVDTRAAVAASDNPDRLFESPDGLHPDRRGLPPHGRRDPAGARARASIGRLYPR